MNSSYVIILIIMAIACYFLFIRKPKIRPTDETHNTSVENEKVDQFDSEIK